MLKKIFNNVFSRTSTRGRLEYLGVTVALSAAAFLFASLGFAATTPAISYLLLLAALVPMIGYWFVVAQRVRDIGWNVPLFVIAMMITNGLTSFAGATENGVFVAFGGPLAIVSIAFWLVLAIMPGKAQKTQVAAPAAA